MRREILSKLGMNSTTFEYSQVPAAQRALGYRLQPDGSYLEEAPLPHGAFGAMGGILTTAADLGAYIAFHLSAWPARDDAEAGPVESHPYAGQQAVHPGGGAFGTGQE